MEPVTTNRLPRGRSAGLWLLVPVSGGASLAPAAPVALAQAALAVHASRRTGALVARQLLQVRGGQPGALLQRLQAGGGFVLFKDGVDELAEVAVVVVEV